MPSRPALNASNASRLRRGALVFALGVAAASWGLHALAAPPTAAAAEGIAWSALTPAQQNSLRPLQRDWDSIDASRKAKWVEIAGKMPDMPPAERDRIQERMSDWAKLSPRERGQARLNFKEAQQLSPQERSARWEAYKALPEDERHRLAARAKPQASKPAQVDEGRGAKSNIVPNPSYAPRPKAVAPTVAQAQPGATTNLITKRPSPPAHQQTGLPKIAASPGFVDQATLLPKRGPQGAATTRSAAASSPGPARP